MRKINLREAFLGKNTESFDHTARNFLGSLDSGKKVFHVDMNEKYLPDVKEKVSSLGMPYLILSQPNDRAAIAFREEDLRGMVKACLESFLDKGMIPVPTPEYMKAVSGDEPKHCIEGLSELQKASLERQARSSAGLSISFEKESDGSYRAIWIKSHDEKAEMALKKSCLCLSNKDYKIALDNEISWRKEQKSPENNISPFEKVLNEHEVKMLAIAERYQQYLTFSDTDHALGKENIDLVNAAEMSRSVSDIANVINENISFEEIKEIVEKANELFEEITIEDYRSDEDIIRESLEADEERDFDSLSSEPEVDDREEHAFMED